METWDLIISTTANEFIDITNIADNVQITVRLMLAILLGGILGYEREQQGKAAGLRTHILVCSATTMLVLAAGPTEVLEDPISRVVQGILAGVGFLCAGSIIKNNVDNDVQGLTTAASVWFTAAIGVVVGLGQPVLSILSALLAVIVLHLMPLIFERNKDRDPHE
ncbi:MAG: MgtC/SapB family protein [Anaerolineaceae bacterium]|nr:MgtC/SapB family protein [Anaerolineaceae bacterium]